MELCSSCKGHCCSRFVIIVTPYDVKKISEALKLDPLKFVDVQPAEFGSKYPSFLLRDGKHVLALDQKLGKRECIFFMKINGIGRCGIHSIRPTICRTYPFELGEGLESVEEYVCPKQYWPKGEKREEFIRNIQKLEKEIEKYKEMVEEWNQNPGKNLHEFLDFCLERLERPGLK